MKRLMFVCFCANIIFLMASVSITSAQTQPGKKLKVLGCLREIDLEGIEFDDLKTKYSDDFYPIYNKTINDFNKEFGISSDIYFYDDNEKGAALAVVDPKGRKDGAVLIGRNLFAKIFKKSFQTPEGRTGHALSLDELAVFFTVVAHELGHISQAKGKVSETVKSRELDADRRAGAVLGKTLSFVLFLKTKPNEDSEEIIFKTARFLFDLGSADFNNIEIHGTKAERMQFFIEGVNIGTVSRTRCPKLMAEYEAKADELSKLEKGANSTAEKKAEVDKLWKEWEVLIEKSKSVGLDLGCNIE